MINWRGYTSTEGFYDSPIMLGAKRVKYERSEVMPIDGLTDIDRPPRCGMLRLGIKKKTADGKKEYPAEVDYFILDPETPDPAEKKRIIDKFHEAFGINPKAIEIVLLHSDINEAFPQNYKRYGKNTPLKCIGDGKTATVTEKDWARGLDQSGVDKRGYMVVDCKGRDCIYSATNEKASNKECKATATLSVKIHQIGGLGVWQLTTGSFNSIVNINSGIRFLIEKYGRAHNLPLMLERRPQETSHKGKKALHYTLHLNETPKTAQAANVIVNTAEIDPDAAQPEILDGDAIEEAEIDRLAANDTPPKKDALQGALEEEVVKSVMKDVEKPAPTSLPLEEGVFESVTKDAEKPVGALQENTKDVAEAMKKVIDTFDGTPANKESKEFLDGLKKDSKEEYGVEGGQPTKSRAIDKENASKVLDESMQTVNAAQKIVNDTRILGALKAKCPEVPELFPQFMAWCKAKLEDAKNGQVYKEAFTRYSVKTPADLLSDLKKQHDMRVHLSNILMDEGLV